MAYQYWLKIESLILKVVIHQCSTAPTAMDAIMASLRFTSRTLGTLCHVVCSEGGRVGLGLQRLLRLGVSWSDATPQAKKQRVNRDVAADVVGALLKETAEFRVFQLTITRAEGFQTVLRQRLVVANAGAAVQPSYRVQSLRPLNDSLFPGSCEQGDMLLKATKHRLTVCLAETGHSAGGTSQAQAVSTQAVSTSQAPMKWTFYVPISQGLYDLLQISESFEKKMTAFFDVGNHAYMKTVASKSAA